MNIFLLLNIHKIYLTLKIIIYQQDKPTSILSPIRFDIILMCHILQKSFAPLSLGCCWRPKASVSLP